MKRLLLLAVLCTTAFAQDEPPKRAKVDPDAPCGIVIEDTKITHQQLVETILTERFYKSGAVANKSDVRSITILASETQGTRHFYQVLVTCFTSLGPNTYSMVFFCDDQKQWAEEFKQFGAHVVDPRLVALGDDLIYQHTLFQRDDIEWPGTIERKKAVEAKKAADAVRSREEADRNRKAANEQEMKQKDALAGEAKSDAAKSISQVEMDLKNVNAVIESERTNYREAVAVINHLTNNKRTPVKEGSDAYWKCQRAATVIKQVESNAASLKAKKAELEGRLQDFQKKAGISPAPPAQ